VAADARSWRPAAQVERARAQMEAMDAKLNEAEAKEREVSMDAMRFSALEKARQWRMKSGTREKIRRALLNLQSERARELLELREKQLELEQEIIDRDQELARVKEAARLPSLMEIELAIRKMKAPEVTRKLVELQGDKSSQRERVARVATFCVEQVLTLSSQGAGGGAFASDKKTLPAIATLMGQHQTDALLQLRACQTLHKMLVRAGTADLARTTGCLRAVVRALQLFTAHGVEILRVTVTPKSTENTQLCCETIQACCDHSESEPWLGTRARGFFALPAHVASSEAVRPAFDGCRWHPEKREWKKFGL